jgi:hypothetical protein
MAWPQVGISGIKTAWYGILLGIVTMTATIFVLWGAQEMHWPIAIVCAAGVGLLVFGFIFFRLRVDHFED